MEEGKSFDISKTLRRACRERSASTQVKLVRPIFLNVNSPGAGIVVF
jgi:hypothetical protein